MVTLQIWTNRLLKEFDGIESRLPSGITLADHEMDPESGVCRACFEGALTLMTSGGKDVTNEAEGSSSKREDGAKAEKMSAEDGISSKDADRDTGDGDEEPAPLSSSPSDGDDGMAQTASALAAGKAAPVGEGKIDGEPPSPSKTEATAAEADAREQLKELRFKIEMDLGLDTRYPFESPVIHVLEGDNVIPSSALTEDLLTLPTSDTWTPSSTVVGTLKDIADMILHAHEVGLPTGPEDSEAFERGDLQAGALVATHALEGCLFPCTPPATPYFAGSLLAPKSRRPLDRYVGVTDKQVLELEAHRTRLNQAVVMAAIHLTQLKKLRFTRGSSVTLVLKQGGSMEFLTPQSHDCVVAITERLEKMGIAGHQTTAGAERQLERAGAIMAALKEKEAAFSDERERPSVALVGECMDMSRQAAELYSAAGDPRHEQVLAHMHAFLQRPEVISVLEGKHASSMDLAKSSAGGTASPESDPASGHREGEAEDVDGSTDRVDRPARGPDAPEEAEDSSSQDRSTVNDGNAATADPSDVNTPGGGEGGAAAAAGESEAPTGTPQEPAHTSSRESPSGGVGNARSAGSGRTGMSGAASLTPTKKASASAGTGTGTGTGSARKGPSSLSTAQARAGPPGKASPGRGGENPPTVGVLGRKQGVSAGRGSRAERPWDRSSTRGGRGRTSGARGAGRSSRGARASGTSS